MVRVACWTILSSNAASLEDKIVQHAVRTVLQCIYEEDFLGFSYGFRPNRSAHDELDALAYAIPEQRVG